MPIQTHAQSSRHPPSSLHTPGNRLQSVGLSTIIALLNWLPWNIVEINPEKSDPAKLMSGIDVDETLAESEELLASVGSSYSSPSVRQGLSSEFLPGRYFALASSHVPVMQLPVLHPGSC